VTDLTYNADGGQVQTTGPSAPQASNSFPRLVPRFGERSKASFLWLVCASLCLFRKGCTSV